MSDTPWTPGPWEVYEHESGALEPFVCVHVRGEPLPNTRANVRLQAAAPEMADILERWVAAFDSRKVFILSPVDEARQILANILDE